LFEPPSWPLNPPYQTAKAPKRGPFSFSAQAGDVMPFNPNFPFVPAGSDGIDEDGLPNDWFVPANPGAVAPTNPNMPAPAPAPNPALPAPNPQLSSATLGPSNQPAPPRPDPFAAYWALIPASRLGALAWAPPIFPSSNPFAFQNIPAAPPPFSLNSPRQFPSATPAPPDDLPPTAPNGLFASIGRMLAARAKPYDPFEAAANGIWGGIAKMIAANAAPDPGARGFLGSLADLPTPPSAQAASYAPYSGPFLPLDPTTLQAGNPPFASLRSDLLNRANPTGPILNQLLTDQALGASDTGGESARPNYLLIAGDNEDEKEKERQKLDPWVSMGLPDVGPTTSPKALPTFPLVLPFSPRPLPPPTPAPQPPPRPSLPPAASPPPLLNPSRAPAPPPRSAGTPTEPVEGDAGAEDASPPGPAGGAASPIPQARGKRYEQQEGSQQTTVRTIIDGKEVTFRLDFPPDENGIKDLKDYKWSRRGYQVPFLQQRVIEDFQAQLRNYQAIHPQVKLQFSEQPPQWVERAIEDAGGTYFVKP
jgi:hypothetical protein